MGASLPGQNIGAARRPWRDAVTQIGSPPHHRGSFAVPDDIVNRSGNPGSAMVFATMP